MLLTDLLPIKYPVLVAPMFLVSNVEMVVAALEFGATAAIPALNYRTNQEMKQAILSIRSKTDKPFGINLIVNKSNPKFKAQLQTLSELKVDFIITSLGSPKETIDTCKPLGIKVFCDVTDVAYAQKVAQLGADAIIAVTNTAGGHCGNLSGEQLIPEILKHCNLPVIWAGGIATHLHYKNALQVGAAGVSVGTLFLAATEAPISDAYKSALISYGAKDIVLTSKLSGSHLTVINTPYVQKTGTKASAFEKFLLSNKRLKKYYKLFVGLKGMQKIRKAAFSATYQTVWCAGPSIEYIHEIKPLKHILAELVNNSGAAV